MSARITTGLLGAGGGAAFAIAALFIAGQHGTGALLASPVAIAIAMPAAHVVSWVLGWPLQQEAALACYALGLLFTVASLGAIAGGLSGALAASPSPSSERYAAVHADAGLRALARRFARRARGRADGG